jgi:hypothetical protein
MVSFEALGPIAMLTVLAYESVAMNIAKLFLETPMRSTSPAVARRAQGPQLAHHVSDPRLHHFWILSILCQRRIAFDHRDQ